MPALIASHSAPVWGTPAALRYAAVRLVPAAIGVNALLSAVGLLLTRVFAASGLEVADHQVSAWFARHRTPTLTTVTHVGTLLADTWTAIALTAVVMLVLRLALRRWREALTVLASILGELWIFLGVTATVHRDRPAVPHLDPAPPTSSFPSGHTGAAVAVYVGLTVVLASLVRRGDIRSRSGTAAVAVGSVLLCCVPVVVGLSRLYRGMHYLTDVLAGAIAGGVWMAVVVTVLLRLGPCWAGGRRRGGGPAWVRPIRGRSVVRDRSVRDRSV